MSVEQPLGPDVPMLDAADPEFAEKFEFAMWSVGGSSDYRNDRGRPYDGQPWTDHGIRGKTEVTGLTMRDLYDCMVQGFLRAVSFEQQATLGRKVVEIDREFMGTEYASRGDWRTQDVYEIDLPNMDPLAVIQNTLCMVEHYMGIYPNVPEVKK